MISKFIILAILIQSSICFLNPDRFCRLAEQTKCEDFKYFQKCGEKFCSDNVSDCKKYLLYERKAYFLRSDVRKLRKSDFVLNFIDFKNKIESCRKVKH